MLRTLGRTRIVVTAAMPDARSPANDTELLGRVAYFRSLTAGERRRLAGCCSPRTLRRGEVLFEEGTRCSGLHIIAEGSIEVRQISVHGREHVFHTEGPGATLGEAPLFDRGGYLASAVALTPARVLFLPRADLLALCERHPPVALAMLEALAHRLRHFAEIATDLAFRPVIGRVARYIVSAASESGRPELDLALTQTQLAARLGTVRELVARALAQLERNGVISRRGSRVVVRDPARLDAIARGEDSDREA